MHKSHFYCVVSRNYDWLIIAFKTVHTIVFIPAFCTEKSKLQKSEQREDDDQDMNSKLEKHFAENENPNKRQRKKISQNAGVKLHIVSQWFSQKQREKVLTAEKVTNRSKSPLKVSSRFLGDKLARKTGV